MRAGRKWKECRTGGREENKDNRRGIIEQEERIVRKRE